MITRNATARWEGDLPKGNGTMNLPNGRFEGPYTFASRFESGKGTNPEELIGAAHAGCFSMALANTIAKAGNTPNRIETTATVHLDKDKGKIVKVELEVNGDVPGIDAEAFQKFAEDAKTNCPVSKSINAEIVVKAKMAPKAAA
ncbi:MAG: OsmC family protein [Euryarchaeota archaeon]|nr:OsmC family protein [Euryarchaeota archaeon]